MSVFNQIKNEWIQVAESSINNYLLANNATLPVDRIEKAILSSWNELVKDCRAASKTDDLICHIVGGQVKAESNQVLPFVKRLKGYFAKANTQHDRQPKDWYYGAADEESF